jgi:D-alanyl-D-alanine carboxypeptidase (penicillin-binding protein 5/6)
MLASLLSLIAIHNLAISPAPLPSNSPYLPTPPPLLTSIAAYPEKSTLSPGPILKAKATLSLDLETGKILFGKNTDQQLPMASLTKLMTILVILDKHNPDEIVTVDKRATQVEPAKMYLLANEEITISELIKAILVKSANDAALALAYHDSASIEEFAQKMNDKAAEIGLRHTNFVNPVGFDNPNQYSTVDDLAILARLTYKNPLVKQFAPITKTTATAVNGSQSHDLDTTNDLLSSYLKVWGLKTGTTDLAGQCLISIVESPTGQKILNIVLNSPARFTESKILSQWIFDNYQWL